jgi:hypothetical protein
VVSACDETSKSYKLIATSMELGDMFPCIIIASEPNSHTAGMLHLSGKTSQISAEATCVNFGIKKTKTELCGLSPRANSSDRANAAFRRSWYQPLLIVGATR